MRAAILKACFVSVALLTLASASARAEMGSGFCHTWSGFQAPEGEGRFGRTLLRNADLFNGLVWLGAAGAIRFGADPGDRWSDTNGFDRGIRDDLVAGSRSARDDAGTASDVLLGITLLAPLALDAGAKSWLVDRDCDRALEIASDWTESLGFLVLVTEATKRISSRERPFGRACSGDPGYSGSCGSDSRFESFFSGHASLSAGAAALLCKDAFQRKVWGESRVTQTLVCGLGVGASVGTGMLRVVSDKHWMTDVLVGWAVGGLVGWFDLPGPFDLLHFKYRHNGIDAEGAWTPVLGRDSVGLAVAMRF